MTEYVKIPKEMLHFLTDEEGSLKNRIEKDTQTKINIDAELCEISIESTQETLDPLKVWCARDIIKAIGRGFEPEVALKLLDGLHQLEIISLSEFVKSKNALVRIRGRVIGMDGKAKERISDVTGSDIVVQGKTVAIIGKEPWLSKAVEAVCALAGGSTHNYAFNLLKAKGDE